ncbi:MAG: phosphoribosyltransferase family protein [Cyanobacteriota bacterium]|nr:phosphoribosyltransferase family protein [Cyanobacteriota bacterium]
MAFHPPLWANRAEAGAELAARLRAGPHPQGPTVLLALPRGGVPVAVEIGRRLNWPVGTWSVRKVADPDCPELAIGAVAAGDVVVWREGASSGDVQPNRLARRQVWLQREERELARRQALFADPAPAQLQGRHLVVVDDGIATGMTVRAALLSLRRCQPASLSLAVPVVDQAVLHDLEPLVDHLVALAVVRQLQAVGLWYGEFDQLSDQRVLELLRQVCPIPQGSN